MISICTMIKKIFFLELSNFDNRFYLNINFKKQTRRNLLNQYNVKLFTPCRGEIFLLSISSIETSRLLLILIFFSLLHVCFVDGDETLFDLSTILLAKELDLLREK